MTAHQNNGLLTKIWGGPGWTFGHAVTFGYPVKPNYQQKKIYKSFFELYGRILPCRFCRESYAKFITEGNTLLDMDAMKNRSSLTRWFYNVHEAVNNKLGVDYGVTYENLVKKFESCRAICSPAPSSSKGCISPLNYKVFSCKRMNRVDCPIVSFDLSHVFILLATIRKIKPKLFTFHKLISIVEGDFSKIKESDEWTERNKYCHQQIVYMRESGIPSIETDGKWSGTPTIDELKLLIHLSSNLNNRELSNCIRALMNNKYYLREIKFVY